MHVLKFRKIRCAIFLSAVLRSFELSGNIRQKSLKGGCCTSITIWQAVAAFGGRGNLSGDAPEAQSGSAALAGGNLNVRRKYICISFGRMQPAEVQGKDSAEPRLWTSQPASSPQMPDLPAIWAEHSCFAPKALFHKSWRGETILFSQKQVRRKPQLNILRGGAALCADPGGNALPQSARSHGRE